MTLSSAVRLRHLATFVAVARAGSMSRAARSLNITQPAVSKTLRELEALLGVALFDRTGRTVTLTRFGALFLRHAEAGLNSFDEGARALSSARDPASLPLRIGALPTVSSRLMPEAVRLFLAEGLGAVPRIVTGPNDHLLHLLREGRLDIVIGRMAEPEAMSGFHFQPLYAEPLCLAVRPGHHLLGQGRLEPAEIASCLLILPPPGSVIRTAVDRFLFAAGIPATAHVVETVSLAFGRAFVKQTDAVWFISEGVVGHDIAEGGLVRLPLDMRTTMGAVGVTQRAGAAVGIAAETFLASLADAARRLVPAAQ